MPYNKLNCKNINSKYPVTVEESSVDICYAYPHRHLVMLSPVYYLAGGVLHQLGERA